MTSISEDTGNGDDAVSQLADIWHQVSSKDDMDVILFAGAVRFSEAEEFNLKLRKHKRRKNALLILTTFGGIPDCAYRMARCLQKCYKDGSITIFVPTYCKSAGTLIAVCADNIIMADDAEFGPLDVQRLHRDVEDRLSGLTSSQALETLCGEVSRSFEKVFVHIRRETLITSDTAAKVAAEIVSGLYQPIFGKLDPMGLGENERSMKVATEYGERLRSRRRNLTGDSLQRLIGKYPSHTFVIDRTEAQEIFRHLRSPNKLESKMAMLLEPIIQSGLFDDEAESVIEVFELSKCVTKTAKTDNDSGDLGVSGNGRNNNEKTECNTSTLQPGKIGESSEGAGPKVEAITSET